MCEILGILGNQNWICALFRAILGLFRRIFLEISQKVLVIFTFSKTHKNQSKILYPIGPTCISDPGRPPNTYNQATRLKGVFTYTSTFSKIFTMTITFLRNPSFKIDLLCENRIHRIKNNGICFTGRHFVPDKPS